MERHDYKMSRIYSILLLSFLFIGTLCAQVTLKIQAPTQAEVGQRIRISYVANTADVEDFQVGDFQGFNVLYGPSTSRSSSFSMTNGRTTQSSTVTFTYTVVPTAQGTYKLPAATIKVEGKSVKSGTVDIEVLPASSSQGQQPSNSQQGGSSRQQQQGTLRPDHLSFSHTGKRTGGLYRSRRIDTRTVGAREHQPFFGIRHGLFGIRIPFGGGRHRNEDIQSDIRP